MASQMHPSPQEVGFLNGRGGNPGQGPWPPNVNATSQLTAMNEAVWMQIGLFLSCVVDFTSLHDNRRLSGTCQSA